ncbi:MAG: UDP-2,3-diacylglucosamine diphosphatase LpxI [Proteobacteria bacterium]|nr:UDP-2,3-diacylglucosamine diphosphatase LpxI [Pseudomonadota bacterium]
MSPRLGIVAGSGVLPGRVVAACRASGRDFFVLAIEGHTDPAVAEGSPHAWVRLGALGKAIRILHDERVGEVCLAGPVRRPSWRELRPDLGGIRFLARVGSRAFGDDGLLSAVVERIEEEGFRVVGADEVAVDLLPPSGPLGRHRPDARAEADIGRGVAVARALGALDVGQAVVVQEGVVLGVEAAEGTDALLVRCGGLHSHGPGGVLVKIPKPQQDRRVDLPTIGPDTVRRAHAAGLSGIAVEAGGTLVLERAEVVRVADELGLFVTGIDRPT